jgi:O-antigen ligase
MMPALLDRCRRGLAVAAAAYVALLPTNAISFWRSLAFGAAALLALVLASAALRGTAPRLPSPGRAIVAALAAWSLWAAASLAWSIDPALTRSELRSELAWGILTAVVFYVATLAGASRVLLAAMLAGLAFWPALAAGLALSPVGWNARLAHMGVVAYSTYLATLAPLLLLLAWPPPLGWNSHWTAPAAGALVLALVVVTARLSDNRIVWLAFGVAAVVLAVAAPRGASRGRAALTAALALVAFGVLFADALRDRAREAYPPRSTVGETLARDPRLAIWHHAAERVRERPLTGYGFGRLILKDEMRADTGDYLLTHAHNMFVSQALQTGAVGVALLAALLGALVARYAALARSGDDTLVRLGALGLAVLAAFVVKNLTDDFFFRANAKLLFAVHATLLGAAVLREREIGVRPSFPESAGPRPLGE